MLYVLLRRSYRDAVRAWHSNEKRKKIKKICIVIETNVAALYASKSSFHLAD